jgi:hypothetical protein
MKNLFSISFSDDASDKILLQAITDDSLYTYFESLSETDSSSNFTIPEPSADFSLFELPEPDLELPQTTSEPVPKVKIFKQIGTLPSEERAKKIQKYLEKKRQRNWHKKIHYSCRKKVADQRVRVKGRFISKQQALSLGIPVLGLN